MRDEFQKQMDRNFNALWEQAIQSKMRDLEFYKKNRNKYMFDFTKEVLRKTIDKYKKVKIETS
jgi:hypothetical protein